MSNTNNTVLSAELREQIRKEAEAIADKTYHHGTLRWVTLMEGWDAGATEYAIWKVRYDELEAKMDNILHEERNAMQAKLSEQAALLRKEYDKLKAENDRLNKIVEQHRDLLRINAGVIEDYENKEFGYKQLVAEHAALKERVQGLVDALNGLLGYHKKSLAPGLNKILDAAEQALQSWNQVKGGEANG